MKSVLVAGSVLYACTGVFADIVDSQSAFKISGEYIAEESNLNENAESPTSDSGLVDLSTTTIVATYETTNESGTTAKAELASGKFQDRKVLLTGKINEPTDIVIEVQIDGNTVLSLPAVLTPGGEEISFAFLDFQSFPPDRLAFVGYSPRVKNPRKKFTISGDFSSIGKDLTLANVRVTGWGYDENGKQKAIGSGDMLLKDGQFLFEGEIEETDLVNIYIQGHDPYFRTQTQAVVERGSVISVYSPESANQIVATSGSGRHAKLIESWQQSDEYLSAMHEYAVAVREFEARQTEQPLLENEESTNSSESNENETLSSESPELEEVDESKTEETKELSTNTKIALVQAEGCEHVVLEDVKHEARDHSSVGNLPRHYFLSQRLAKIESDALEAIASNAEDSFDALLAMELGAFNFQSENRKKGLAVYDRLATELDEELVARRVSPSRDSLASYIEVNDNDSSLVPGQKVPNFQHPNLEGEETSLQDILEDKAVVLIDFWASWCAPCIAKFPKMKELYGAYGGEGFEILSNSIDSTQEAWEQASAQHELPWTSVGEIEGWYGATARAYGVQHIPKSYLVDSEGCILQKDIAIEDLEEVLVSRFGSLADAETVE